MNVFLANADFLFQVMSENQELDFTCVYMDDLALFVLFDAGTYVQGV